MLLTMRWFERTQALLLCPCLHFLACIPHAHTASAHATWRHRNDDDETGRDDVPYLRVMSDSPQQRTSCDPSAVVPSSLVVTIHTEFDGRESTPSPRTSVEALRELVSEEPAAAYFHTHTHTRVHTGARMHTCMRTCLCIRPNLRSLTLTRSFCPPSRHALLRSQTRPNIPTTPSLHPFLFWFAARWPCVRKDTHDAQVLRLCRRQRREQVDHRARRS